MSERESWEIPTVIPSDRGGSAELRKWLRENVGEFSRDWGMRLVTHAGDTLIAVTVYSEEHAAAVTLVWS